MSDQAAWADYIVEWARRFHIEYEYQAKRFGWQSQTPVSFDELPEANKQTMLNTVAAVMGSEVYPRDRELESRLATIARLSAVINEIRELSQRPYTAAYDVISDLRTVLAKATEPEGA